MSVSREPDPSTSTATHWGTYFAQVREGKLVAVQDYPRDPDPADIGPGIVDAIDDRLRIRRPMVRKGWLTEGPRLDGGGRGAEPFVAVPWDEALDLVAAEIERVRREHGNQAIFGGSYGWGSAGRFHHAQSQIHRFLNCAGGYVRHVNTYSHAAAEVVVNRVVGRFREVLDTHTRWPTIAEHGDLVVAFGGLPRKNAQVTSGGVGRHTLVEGLRACRAGGVRFVSITPLRDDVIDELDARWLAPRPGTDTALMLGLAHTLLAEDRHDRAFLARYCEGFDRFARYLTGAEDGQAKDAGWAAAICGLEAETIRELAREMASGRTLINVAWGVQRGDHGEQPVWMAITLAAMLGQIGLPGGGFGVGYSSENGIGNATRLFPWPAVNQGQNPVSSFIPVARIADMLLDPGGAFDYDGARHTYPDVRLVYWAGGNPFHHHQDLNRLVRAWQRPETVVVNEIWWNALARHADIVLPVTTTLEREDLALPHWDPTAVAMRKAVDPIGESRSDFAIFSGLARRLGVEAAYTEGRTEEDWLRHLWDQARQRAGEHGFELPTLEGFRKQGTLELPEPERHVVLLEDFRADPDAHPLPTPSGRIEIFSAAVAGFGYDDCPGHPVWHEPREWLGSALAERYPLHLISNQPRTRLHSQLDNGGVSRGAKVAGREPITLHPEDARARGIRDGDVVRVFNDRGACLAGAVIADTVMRGVVRLPTGAWYDPSEPGKPGSLEKHGNPNVLTRDEGTSRLAQGPTAHSVLVEVERFEGVPPPVTAFEPPPIEERDGAGARSR
ncbi:MAG: molybdopterin guanine dinucleotide-containing S/N-oxide reductase [Ectothiorhodospiraceae bacterium]|nr:molybdopterin guanine dinucleotide-containing S/N-oxide reductase [Chromatiales bacterium]MCP5154515.1 molybdopterin guanine dinucleotide-containing S/N-oxide reductase [Ectothiorhodospiraceae bacterium]